MEIFSVTTKSLVGEKKWKIANRAKFNVLHKAMDEFSAIIEQERRLRGFNNPISVTVSDNYKTIYATFSIR